MINIAAELKDLPAIAQAFPGVCAEQNPETGEWFAIVPEDVANQVQALLSSVADLDAARASRLTALKKTLCARVDQEAEDQRARYITAGSGQAMTYQAKAEEARRFEAEASSPDGANYPLLSAEVGITAPTLSEVAASVLAANAAWLVAGAVIEAKRLGAKKEITAAVDADSAREAFAQVEWPGA